MTILGWICMVCSLGCVWSLAGICYYLMLTDAEPPVEEVHHLHSA